MHSPSEPLTLRSPSGHASTTTGATSWGGIELSVHRLRTPTSPLWQPGRNAPSRGGQARPRVKTEGDVNRNYVPQRTLGRKKHYNRNTSGLWNPFRSWLGHLRSSKRPSCSLSGDWLDGDMSLSGASIDGQRPMRATMDVSRSTDDKSIPSEDVNLQRGKKLFRTKLKIYVNVMIRTLLAPFVLLWGTLVLLWAGAKVAYLKFVAAARSRTIRYWIVQKVPLLGVIRDFHRSLWLPKSSRVTPEGWGSTTTQTPAHRKKAVILSQAEVIRIIMTELVGGIVEAIMALPQSMSYAMLAVLPPVNGLYNQAVFPFLFSPFTTAPTVAVGVSAIENLMAGDSVTRLLGGVGTDAERVNCASALTAMTGLMMFVMYLCRLGVISSLLPDPVIEGFSTASAFVIGISQLKYAFGLQNVPSGLSPIGTVIYCLQRLGATNPWCILITFISLILLTSVKLANTKCPKVPLPGPLLVVVLGIVVASYCELDQAPHNVPVVGEIPSGLPSFTVPSIQMNSDDVQSENEMKLPNIWNLWREALLMALLYFIVHVSVARTISFRTGSEVVPNQELLALSITNVGGSFFQTFPNASSISRTSVVTAIGCLTSIHSLVSASFVMMVVQVATGLFAMLPFACLAAIVLSGVTGMISFTDLRSLYVHQLSRLQQVPHENDDTALVCPDFLLWCSAFVVTLAAGALEGIIFSLALSVTLIIAGYSRPPTVVLGRLPGCNIFRNVKRFPMAHSYPGMTILRFDASLNFSNSDFFRSMINSKVDQLLDDGVQFEASKFQSSTDDLSTGGAINMEITTKQRNFLRSELRKGIVSTLDQRFQPATDMFSSPGLISNWCYPPVMIIDASSMNELDLTAVRMLEKVVPDVEHKGVLLLLANWKGPVRDFLDFCNFYRTLPPDRCFLGLYDAVVTGLKYQHRVSSLICGEEVSAAPQFFEEVVEYSPFMNPNGSPYNYDDRRSPIRSNVATESPQTLRESTHIRSLQLRSIQEAVPPAKVVLHAGSLTGPNFHSLTGESINAADHTPAGSPVREHYYHTKSDNANG